MTTNGANDGLTLAAIATALRASLTALLSVASVTTLPGQTSASSSSLLTARCGWVSNSSRVLKTSGSTGTTAPWRRNSTAAESTSQSANRTCTIRTGGGWPANDIAAFTFLLNAPPRTLSKASSKLPDILKLGGGPIPRVLTTAARPHADEAATLSSLGVKLMPLVDVHVIKGVFSKEQKQDIITRITDTMVAIEGEALRGVTWVRIVEVNEGEWAIGGQPLTAAMVHQMQGAAAQAA
ncbi:MAG: tautomerase family protein [Lysobacterales bacterium]